MINSAYRKLLLQAAETYGTPVYVYNLNKIEEQYTKIKKAFSSSNSRFFYACKAANNINILRFLNELGAGCDAVSLEEVELALQAGFKPENIIFTPNCVSFEEYKKAVEKKVIINIDNISILEQFGNEFGNSVPICIRINPHIMAGGNYQISTGHIDSKFGISIHQIRHVVRIVESYKIKVNGLHMHTGSDILDASVFIKGMEILFELAESHFPHLNFIDFGSGFKVPYKNDDIKVNMDEIGAEICKNFNAFCDSYGKKLAIWFEPGKYLVSEAGTFLTKVNVLKQTTATVFAGVNSGFNHLIRPMFYDAYHTIENISKPNGTKRIYTVVGNICETDIFAWDRQIAEIHEGDVLAIHNAGAYGFTMSSNYNSRVRPAEVIVYNNQLHLARKREDFEDITRNMIAVNLK